MRVKLGHATLDGQCYCVTESLGFFYPSYQLADSHAGVPLNNSDGL